MQLVLIAAALLGAAAATTSPSSLIVQPDEMLGATCGSIADCGFLPGLACVDSLCHVCSSDRDCTGSDSDFSKRCVVASTGALVRLPNATLQPLAYCMEKNMFAPFTLADLMASLLAFLCTALGSASGAGGGGLLVPMYILAVGLGPKHAIPLSKATIFGGALATFLSNFRKKHPYHPRRPVIDYALAGMMEPPTLMGTIFGVMANATFPSWLILSLLVTLLSFMAYRTLQKVQHVEAQEGRARGETKVLLPTCDQADAEHQARTRQEDEDDFASLPPLEFPPHADKQASLDAIRDQLYDDERSVFPLTYVLPLVACWLIIFVQSLFRGGHGTPSIVGVPCGSSIYWALTFVPLLLLVLITWLMGHRLRTRNRLMVVSGIEFAQGDVHWTYKKAQLVFPSYCFVAGIASGLLGIGGGMVQSPIMLEYGLLPVVSSASASYMILFTSSATTLQFAVAGQFPGQRQYDYILWFSLMGFLGGIFGQKCVGYLLKKYNRTSILVYILAFVIGASAIAMGVAGFQNVVRDFSKGVHLGFSGLCAV
ncbi:hypothetical protein SDRG_07755 [Saprolegnia diclina VS20]|uniref:Membrane transporter protein n=1 Tax=Saprolegnia diclina (strain VS20) TaxID=1156394 RepID=T0RRB4_SAPDV|nr:hypothetical protein SDRG_07755 [Saprolegnia diclina VS20]EQC34958.1 hypothetical protein SDRG_07755 [Saprolegnia diclina VS20]|eukprot:XP_008611830.1 hypothetical protein SDRG_07755 [Saprolegnia diclina VS20]